MLAGVRLIVTAVGAVAAMAVAVTVQPPAPADDPGALAALPQVRSIVDPHLRIQSRESLRIRGWHTTPVRVDAGSNLSRTVRVTPPKRVRAVRMQRWQAGDKWRTVDTSLPNRKGRTTLSWQVSGDTDIQLRILAKAKSGWASTATTPQPVQIVGATTPVPDPTPTRTPTPTPDPSPTSDPAGPPSGPGFEMPATIPTYPTAAVGQPSQYTWLDDTARWHPCTQAITWHQDLGDWLSQYGGTQSGEQSLTAGALTTISQLSGYPFVQVQDAGAADVVIEGTDELPGSAIGLGGFSSMNDIAVSGTVTIDVPQMASLPANMRQAVYAHELGHVLGLGHTDGNQQTMYPSLSSNNAAFGLGDQAGFAAMPGGASCG